MGPSGSGKSTLLTIAGTLEEATSGRVRGRRAGHVADVAQRSRPTSAPIDRLRLPGLQPAGRADVPPRTCRCRLELDGTADQGGAYESRSKRLEELGLADRADRYPDELSGGERQRVAIARAVVGDRRLLLADEPTGALDSVNGEGVMRLVRAACKRGVAGVMVTHDAQLASWADRVVFLRDGRVVDQTAPAAGPESLLSPRRAMSDTTHRRRARTAGRRALGLAPVPPRLAPAPADRAAPHCRRSRLPSGSPARRYNVAPASGQAEFGDANHWFAFNDPDPATLQAKLDAGDRTVRRDRRDRAPSGPRAGDGQGGRLPIAAAGRPVRRAAARPAIGSLSDGGRRGCGHRLGRRFPRRRRSARRSISTASPRTVVGIVENPSDFDDEFVLLPPSALAALGRPWRALRR